MEIQGSYSPFITNESGAVPRETEVAKTLYGSRYFRVATADRIFIVDAGLRCEYAFDSKTISPVLKSSSETDGFPISGSAARRANTPAADTGSKAEALGIANNVTESNEAQRLDNFFINLRIQPF
jgi:hypothetical protein